MYSEKNIFIKEIEIENIIAENSSPSEQFVDDILAKAKEKHGLTLKEAAALLSIKDQTQLNKLYDAANQVKLDIYGNRIVIFAPLYVSNECVNICDYCGFRADNTELHRKTLTSDELKEEADILMEHGHKRLLLVYGEHPKFDGRWIADTVRTVYKASHNHNAIRRLNINAAPMDVENFKIVKESGIGTYQCFQETYHQKTYKKVHLKGHKTDYMNRLLVHDRAFEAGIDDVGLGVLFGLYDWKFETLALLQHSFYLDEKYGVGPHTISFPRLEPALNAPLSCSPPVDVDDTAIKKIVAVIRLAIPYTGIILSTRETHELRNDLLHLGVSQISAGSRTYPGAYHNDKYNKPDMQQFTIGDSRSLDEVINDLIQQDYIPSFCTSCYRKGRTGPTFMEYAKPGSIHNFCGPNAILTLFEYITDYATSETKEIGWNLIQKELNNITDQKMREFLTKQIYNIRSGERDILL